MSPLDPEVIKTTQRKIKEKGCAILGFRSEGRAGYAHTVGLTEKGSPELFLYLPDAPPNIISGLLDDLNGVAFKALEGEITLRSGMEWSVNGGSYSIRVENPATPRPLRVARHFYPLGFTVLDMIHQPA